MKTAIVTGANGFIGRHLVAELRKRGVFVVAVARSFDGALKSDGGICCVDCAGKTPQELKSALADLRADCFFHLAWAGVAVQMRNSVETQFANVGLALDAVRLAKECGAKKFVLPGSTSEYAYSDGPINENSLPTPMNAYGAAKLAARYLCAQLAKELELPFVYAAITGIYGGGRSDGNVISYAIEKLLRGEKPVLTALEQKWDYAHIDDVTAALFCIGEKGKAGAFYAVGRGDNVPLSQYVCKIRDLINPELPLGIGERPYENGRLPQSCVDLTAIREDTGFAPKVDFEVGIKKEIERAKNAMQNLQTFKEFAEKYGN